MNVTLGASDGTNDNIDNASKAIHGYVCPITGKYNYIRYKF